MYTLYSSSSSSTAPDEAEVGSAHERDSSFRRSTVGTGSSPPPVYGASVETDEKENVRWVFFVYVVWGRRLTTTGEHRRRPPRPACKSAVDADRRERRRRHSAPTPLPPRPQGRGSFDRAEPQRGRGAIRRPPRRGAVPPTAWWRPSTAPTCGAAVDAPPSASAGDAVTAAVSIAEEHRGTPSVRLEPRGHLQRDRVGVLLARRRRGTCLLEDTVGNLFADGAGAPARRQD